MARPIKETPTLYGEDARRFEQAVKHPQKATQAELQKMNDAYNWFMSIARCTF